MPFKAVAEEPGQLVHIHPSLLHTVKRTAPGCPFGRSTLHWPRHAGKSDKRGRTDRRCDWLTQAPRPIDQSVSEPQVPWEECALPWQHEAEPRNKLWRWDVRRLPMMEAIPCASPTGWREDASGGAGHTPSQVRHLSWASRIHFVPVPPPSLGIFFGSAWCLAPSSGVTVTPPWHFRFYQRRARNTAT